MKLHGTVSLIVLAVFSVSVIAMADPEEDATSNVMRVDVSSAASTRHGLFERDSVDALDEPQQRRAKSKSGSSSKSKSKSSKSKSSKSKSSKSKSSKSSSSADDPCEDQDAFQDAVDDIEEECGSIIGRIGTEDGEAEDAAGAVCELAETVDELTAPTVFTDPKDFDDRADQYCSLLNQVANAVDDAAEEYNDARQAINGLLGNLESLDLELDLLVVQCASSGVDTSPAEENDSCTTTETAPPADIVCV
jgi:hypothetical protein